MVGLLCFFDVLILNDKVFDLDDIFYILNGLLIALHLIINSKSKDIDE